MNIEQAISKMKQFTTDDAATTSIVCGDVRVSGDFARANKLVLCEVERLTQENTNLVDIVAELRKLACDLCSQDCPFDGPGHHIEGDCDAWTDTEAEEAKGSGEYERP